jgi:hypothetical protein
MLVMAIDGKDSSKHCERPTRDACLYRQVDINEQQRHRIDGSCHEQPLLPPRSMTPQTHVRMHVNARE